MRRMISREGRGNYGQRRRRREKLERRKEMEEEVKK